MEIRTSLAIALMERLNELKKKKLPARLSYAVNRNIHALTDICSSFDQERQKLILQYAKKDESGEVCADKNGKIEWEDADAFNRAIREILAEEETVSFRQVGPEILDMCDEGRYDPLTPEDMEALSYMIEEV